MNNEQKRRYLSQARRLDEVIKIKLMQYEELKAIAEKTTSQITGMPKGGSKGDALVKVADMSREIDREIDELVDLKWQIRQVIKTAGDLELIAVLEAYYLTRNSWEQVAKNMNYSLRTVLRLHDKAIKRIEIKEQA